MFQSSRPILSLLIGAVLVQAAAALPAAAQETIPTAQDDQLGGAPPPPPLGSMILQPRHDERAANIIRAVGPCGGLPDPKTGKLDKSPHGEVFAGAGSAGYREAGGEVCLPVGDHIAAHLAVDVGRYPYYGWPP